MITGWPRLSDNFCPTIRAMMSLPPPGVKPTTMWIGRVGYLDASSWADAPVIAIAASATNTPITQYLRRFLMSSHFTCGLRTEQSGSKPRHLNMQHRGFALIQRGQAAVDSCGEIVGFADAFAVRAERPCHGGKVALLALASRCQP